MLKVFKIIFINIELNIKDDCYIYILIKNSKIFKYLNIILLFITNINLISNNNLDKI